MRAGKRQGRARGLTPRCACALRGALITAALTASWLALPATLHAAPATVHAAPARADTVSATLHAAPARVDAVSAALQAAPDRGSARTDALRALSRRGYRRLQLRCVTRSGRASCSWTGFRAGKTCSGTVLGRRSARGRWHEQLGGVRCRSSVSRAVPPATVPPVWGFNAYTSDQTVAMQREVGATATRLFVSWSDAEPTPGVWRWQQFDQSYQKILAGGLHPLVVAFSAPCWTTPQSGCSALTASPPDPAHDADWALFVRQLAARYPKAMGIEIWSEPNLTSNFYPHPDPTRYTQLLKEGYGAVKSVDPAMPVVSGGLLLGDGTGTGSGGEASQSFLASMYAAGAEHYMDALGIHIYPSDPAAWHSPEVWDPAAMTRWLDQVAAVTRAAGVVAKPLWVTEMGVSTATQPGFPVKLTAQQQATDLDTMLRQAEADPLIRVVMVHTLQDAYPNPLLDLISNIGGGTIGDDVFFNQINEGFGVFTFSWGVKPAACVVSRTFGGWLSC